MQVTDTLNDDIQEVSDDELHTKAKQFITESNQLLFRNLPNLMSQIINQETWKSRNNTFKNFGEYALNKTSEGLGIANNEMLWLLKSAMKKNTKHKPYWGEVLDEVDTSVRKYAKEKKIPVKDLNKSLTDYDSLEREFEQEQVITYLPSRSKSEDGQLIKLKSKDPRAYDHVVQGTMQLKEAFPKSPRAKLDPVESVKNKFASLSKSDREAFLAWLERERENLV